MAGALFPLEQRCSSPFHVLCFWVDFGGAVTSEVESKLGSCWLCSGRQPCASFPSSV